MDPELRLLQRAWHATGDTGDGARYIAARARVGDAFPLDELVEHAPLEMGPSFGGYGVALADFRRHSDSIGLSPRGSDGQYRPWTLSELFCARVRAMRNMLGISDGVSLRSLGDVLRVGLECFETQYDGDGSRLSAKQRVARLLSLNYAVTASGYHYRGGSDEFAFKRECPVLLSLLADDRRVVIPQVYDPQGGIVFHAGLRIGRHQAFNELLPRGLPARHPYWVDAVAQGEVKLIEDYETAHYAAHEMRFGQAPEGAMGVWVPFNDQGVFGADDLRPALVGVLDLNSNVGGYYVIVNYARFVRVANQSERSEPPVGGPRARLKRTQK